MKKRHILFLILAMVLALGVFVSAQASVTTAESGPAIGKHQPQAYAIDTDTGIVTNLTTGEQVSEKKTNEMPVLYGGDTLEFHYGANKLYYVFVDSKGDFTPSPPPGADGQTRLKVLGTAKVAWGDVTLNVLTKIEILGDDIVQLNEGLFTSGGGINLFVLKYAHGPRWCNINSELWFIKNSDHHQLSAAESASAAYYTNEGSTTRTWAEDCLLNGYSATHKDVLLTLRRPYIEGLFFTGVGFDSKTGRNQISKEYRIVEGNGWHGNFWEGWEDNQIEIYTSLMKTGGNYDGYPGYGHSSYDDELLVRFNYTTGRTVTFDACGGTIDGYRSRIYEAEGRQFFNDDLQQGKVDEAVRKGTGYVPVRKGWYFAGWYEDAAYKKPVTSIKDTVNKYSGNSDKASERICRLYAKWVKPAGIKDCKLEKIEDQVYTGKAIEPKLKLTYKGEALEKGKDYTVTFKNNKNIGTATVTITGKGRFSGKRTAEFLIVPKDVKLSSLKAGSGALTVKWKKGTGIDGYEIAYSLNKDFKGAKSVTVSKAKTACELKDLEAKKTYYVRIRTFKKVKGKTYYSAWSKALSKKTK